jgi:hypothetical protein
MSNEIIVKSINQNSRFSMKNKLQKNKIVSNIRRWMRKEETGKRRTILKPTQVNLMISK